MLVLVQMSCHVHEEPPHSLILSCILLPTWLVVAGHIAVLCWVALLSWIWVSLLSWVTWLLVLVLNLICLQQ